MAYLLVQYEPFLSQIVANDTVFDDLQMLYTPHFPTSSEWKNLLEYYYHELLPEISYAKTVFEKNYHDVETY
jgi:hypothetical protein